MLRGCLRVEGLAQGQAEVRRASFCAPARSLATPPVFLGLCSCKTHVESFPYSQQCCRELFAELSEIQRLYCCPLP